MFLHVANLGQGPCSIPISGRSVCTHSLSPSARPMPGGENMQIDLPQATQASSSHYFQHVLVFLKKCFFETSVTPTNTICFLKTPSAPGPEIWALKLYSFQFSHCHSSFKTGQFLGKAEPFWKTRACTYFGL